MGLEDVEGVIDDTPKVPATEEPPADNTKELVGGLQDQISNLSDRLNKSSSERDEIVDSFSKAVGFIEGTGAGRYDKETGQIVRVEAQPTGPDPMDELKTEIAATEKDLTKQFKSGDISSEEYYDAMQSDVAPLKEKYQELKFDKKFTDIERKLAPKEQSKAEQQAPAQQQSNKVKSAYDNLANEYPEITDKASPLFKKMDEIYSQKRSLYANANYADGSGNPDQYKDLIERAAIELKAEGVEVNKEKVSVRNQYATPNNKGYQAQPEKGYEMDKAQVNMCVSQGINSKSLLSDVNKAMTQYENTGNMVMED